MRIEIDEDIITVLPPAKTKKVTKRWKVTIPKTKFIVVTITDDNGTKDYKFPKTATGNRESINLLTKLRKDIENCPFNINAEILRKLRKERDKVIDKETAIEKAIPYYTGVLNAVIVSIDKYTSLVADPAKKKSIPHNTTRLQAYTVKQTDYNKKLTDLNTKLQKTVEIRHAITDKITPVQTLLSTLTQPGPISVSILHV